MPLPRFDKLDEPRKSSILVAAAEEFGERGFEGASYNRIIKRAGISKGAMYYYFADKDDLFRTVLQTALGEWLGEVGFPFQADDATSFWTACETMYARSLEFMLRDRRNAALCLSITRLRTAHGGHPIVRELNEQIVAWLSALVQQGRELGAVREDVPADLQVHAAIALMDGGDRWLAERWDDFEAADVATTAAMMAGMFRRLAGPDAL
jgi:AcrR family transcriptional regulator